jgi:hypothetical protein
MIDQEATSAVRLNATTAQRSKLNRVDFSGFLAFNPPPRVRADVHKMIYDGCYMADVHPSTWKFLRKHNLSVTLWGPGK